MKLIRFSNRAETQMILRGAKKEEVETAIQSGRWKPAKLEKLMTKYCFEFNSISPINQKFYKYKIVEPIFADETNGIIVITVKVYYSNEEVEI
ncbi:MAG: lipoprotein 17-related variable surface protein [Thermodesulfovibrionales bacterium]